MRTIFALITGCIVAALTVPPGLSARSLGTVSGQALDAGGRPLANVRMELVEGGRTRSLGRVVQETLTGVQGGWTFGRVPRGEYVVRMGLGGHTTGVQVEVGERPLGPVVVVAPSIATRSMQGGVAAAGILGALGGGSAAVGAAVVTGIVAGATIGVMAATDVGPFKDDQS